MIARVISLIIVCSLGITAMAMGTTPTRNCPMDADQAKTPEERAKAIFHRFQASQLPKPNEGLTYYTGPCVALGGSVDPRAQDWALLGISRSGENIETTWWVAYTGDVDGQGTNSWAEMNAEALQKYYPVHGFKPLEDQGRWLVKVTDTVTPGAPKLFYRVGEDRATKTVFVLGTNMAYMYCALDLLTEVNGINKAL